MTRGVLLDSKSDSEAGDRARDSTGPFAFFTALWSISVLFHCEWGHADPLEELGGPEGLLWQWTLFLVASCVLALPRAKYGLLALAIVQIIDVVIHLPQPTNHWLLAGFSNIAIISSYFIHWSRRNDPRFRRVVVKHFTSGLRWVVLVFYPFTALWKLNTDYYNPETGCGALFFLETIGPARDSVAGLTGMVSTAVIVAEFALPVFLAIPRTRRLAIFAGLLFHFCLGLNLPRNFLNFSSVMFPLLIAFDIQGFSDALQHYRRYLLRSLDAVRLTKYLRLGFVLLFVGAVGASQIAFDHAPFATARAVAFLVYSLLLLRLGMRLLRNRPRPTGAGLLPIHVMQWLAPLLVFANGIAPILGLKTTSSWQMYSNVVITESSSNHLLIPRSLDLWGHLEDRVVILESDDRWLSQLASSGDELPWFELRRYAQSAPDAAVIYRRRGKIYEASRLDSDPTLSSRPPWWELKTFYFHPVPSGAPPCVW